MIYLTDWTAVGDKGQEINFDIRSTPLQIHTDSEIGSGDLIWAQFVDADGNGRGISVYFNPSPRYEIGYCVENIEISLEKLGIDKNRIWTIEMENTRIKLYCNGMQIFDYDPQQSSDEKCRQQWSLESSSLKFGQNTEEMDTASDFYREFKTVCTNLPDTWTSVQTETEFPVETGTTITVSCLEGFINTGSKVVTCNTYLYQDFQYETLPYCTLDWTAVGDKGQEINFDIRSTPLQIHADSEIGSGDLIWAQFVDADGNGRGISVYFNPSPRYEIGYCVENIEISLEKLGIDKNRIWTIEMENTRIKLYCNGMQIFDYDPQQSTDEKCRQQWSLESSSLKFGQNTEEMDTASDFYREFKTVCTNLPDTWTSVQTETEFPVETGTTITVSCLEGYINTGSKVVTCNTYLYQDFQYETLPCSTAPLDWTAVGERNQEINFSIQSNPLQIQTDSEIGSGDLIWTQFIDSDSDGRGIAVKLNSLPHYEIGFCNNGIGIPLDKLGTDKYRIWTFEQDDTRIKLYCNGMQIFDYDPQHSTVEKCRQQWSLKSSILKFGQNSAKMDTASDFYRDYKTGME
ncbi:hypothetical protein ACHWQZ_G013619 [Mnemiopsis leidyi]